MYNCKFNKQQIKRKQFFLLYFFSIFSSAVKVANRAADIVFVLTVLEYSYVVIFAKNTAQRNQQLQLNYKLYYTAHFSLMNYKYIKQMP